MKIKYSALVSDARGKLNGSVASKNRYGQYLRNKMTPVNPQTDAQMAVRGRFGTLSKSWSLLTQIERDSWASAAKNSPETNIFGDQITLQPNAFFIKRNMLLLTAGLAAIDSAVTLEDIEWQGITFTELTTTAIKIGLEAERFSLGGEAMVVYATRPVSPGREFLKNDFRVIGVLHEDDFEDGATYAPADITALYVAKFGSLEAGKRVGVAIKVVNSTGAATLPATVSAIVGN